MARKARAEVAKPVKPGPGLLFAIPAIQLCNYDFGAKTRTEGPPPAGQAVGAIQVFAYDNALRLDLIYNGNNGARIDYTFGPNYTVEATSTNSLEAENQNGVRPAILRFHQHLNFNERLQNTSLTLSNVATIGARCWTYGYYADGKLATVTDGGAPNFDRFFDYDHEGRPVNALTGSEARWWGRWNPRGLAAILI